jgi:hypothetical protein
LTKGIGGMKTFKQITLAVISIAAVSWPVTCLAQTYWPKQPVASMSAAGPAGLPIASILAVNGPLMMFDVSKASGPAGYISIPTGAAAIMDTGNGFIVVKASKPCKIVQVVVEGDRAAAAVIDVDPTPIVPVTPPPTPTPTPLPVDPTPTPVGPTPVIPHADQVWVILIHDPTTDTPATTAGVSDMAFWQSLQASGNGQSVVGPTGPIAAMFPESVKRWGVPVAVVVDFTTHILLADQKYTDNANLQALVDQITGSKPARPFY